MNFQELEIAKHFYYASIIKAGNTERIKMAFPRRLLGEDFFSLWFYCFKKLGG